MNGTKVDEFEATYTGRPKTVFSIGTGRTINLTPGDRHRIAVNQYGNAYIDDQYVGDVSDFTKEADA